jgi:Fic family protein
MEFWGVRQAAEHWGVSERWAQRLLAEGRVPGAVREGRRWQIPAHTPRPIDERAFRYLDVPAALRGLLAAADALRDDLGSRRPLTEGEVARVRQEFAVEYTYDSNAIEGSTLTLRETALILEGITIGEKPLKEHLEAVGHRDAYEYVESLAARVPPEPITVRVVKDVHFLVLADRPADRGAFRGAEVRILGTSHKPPPPYLVREHVEELLAELPTDRHHPLDQAARFHLRFESIHPFIDGNGRTGRLLLNLMLLRAGYLPINIKHADRRRYYDCFQAWDDHQDSEPMTALVVEYAERRLREQLAALG